MASRRPSHRTAILVLAGVAGVVLAHGLDYVLAVHSNHGVWQVVEDEANPPAFNPREAAERVPPERWQQVVRRRCSCAARTCGRCGSGWPRRKRARTALIRQRSPQSRSY